MTDFKQLRERNCRLRLTMPAAEREQAAAAIRLHIAQSVPFQRAVHVAAYSAIRGEVDLKPLWGRFGPPAKHWYLPVIHPGPERRMQFARHDPSIALTNNRLGIPEPDPAQATIAPQDIDLVLTPLVAFDRAGHRIGMGAGYYDRAFAFMRSAPMPSRPLLIGVGYEFQRVDSIDPRPWDVPLAGIVTEAGVYEPGITSTEN